MGEDFEYSRFLLNINLTLIIMVIQMTNIVQNSKDSALLQPYDLDIDPYTGLLYWSDQNQNVINVTRLDGTPVGIVVRSQHERPRSLVLAPKHGLVTHRVGLDGIVY